MKTISRHLSRHLSLSTLALMIIGHTAVLTHHAHAEQIKIPVGQQGTQYMGEGKDRRHTIDMPKRGMKNTQVSALFGEPSSKEGPRGEPPISFWEYPEYTVYYEFDRVIHTVLKKRP